MYGCSVLGLVAGARAYSTDEPCPGTAARIVAFNQAQAAAQPHGEAYQRPNVPTDGSFAAFTVNFQSSRRCGRRSRASSAR